MTTVTAMLAQLPFSGFYDGHDLVIDDAMQVATEEPIKEDGSIDWRRVHLRYAACYVQRFATEMEIKGLEFNKILSPREYNFANDRILVKVPMQELQRILDGTSNQYLGPLVSIRLQPRSGFIPFYSADWTSWGPLETWSPPQLGLLLEAYAVEMLDDQGEYPLELTFEQERELMHEAPINEWVDDAIEEGY